MILRARQGALGTLEHLRRLTRLATVLKTLVAEGVPAESQQARLVLAGRRVRAVARGTAQHAAWADEKTELERSPCDVYASAIASSFTS